MDERQLQEMIDKVKACEDEIGKGIIGQRDIIRQVMLAILSDGNVLLEGVPGLGKTELVKTISKVMSTSFSRIQFTPDLMPADVTGTNLIIKQDGNNVFQFEPGPIFANIVLGDEINRATPKTQSALLEAMQEKTVTVGKTTYELPAPFMVLATQNPIENEGTYPPRIAGRFTSGRLYLQERLRQPSFQGASQNHPDPRLSPHARGAGEVFPRPDPQNVRSSLCRRLDRVLLLRQRKVLHVRLERLPDGDPVGSCRRGRKRKTVLLRCQKGLRQDPRQMPVLTASGTCRP